MLNLVPLQSLQQMSNELTFARTWDSNGTDILACAPGLRDSVTHQLRQPWWCPGCPLGSPSSHLPPNRLVSCEIETTSAHSRHNSNTFRPCPCYHRIFGTPCRINVSTSLTCLLRLIVTFAHNLSLPCRPFLMFFLCSWLQCPSELGVSEPRRLLEISQQLRT